MTMISALVQALAASPLCKRFNVYLNHNSFGHSQNIWYGYTVNNYNSIYAGVLAIMYYNLSVWHIFI